MFALDNLARSLSELGGKHDRNAVHHLFGELHDAYTEPARFYHTDRHVAECLSHFQSLRHLAAKPAEIEAAIWFHDAVYDATASDNEERSATWAERALHSFAVDAGAIERVVDMVIATKTHETQSGDAELMLDVDLGILGAPVEVFERYDADIRREYHFVPESQFKIGRANILEGFLARPAIFKTDIFKEQFETPARANLRRKIDELRAGHTP